MFVEKVFTNDESNNIIKKDYDPFTVNEKYLQRKGLFMKRIENETLNEVKNELNWKEKIIIRIFNKTFYKISDLIRINTVNNMIK